MGNWRLHTDDRNALGRRAGTTQDDRKLPALLPSYIGIDESDHHSFVRFLKRYAEVIAFWDNENKLMGSWRNMLEKSSLLSMLSFNARDITHFAELFHTEVEQLVAEAESHRMSTETLKLKLQAKPLSMATELLADIVRLCLETPKAESLQRELKVIVQNSLNPICKKLILLSNKFSPEATALVRNPILEFPPEWGLSNYQEDDGQGLGEADDQQVEGMGKLPPSDVLTLLFNDLLQIVYLIRASVDQYIQKDMMTGLVKPHVATLMAFFQMMKVAYAELNKFTERHLDYYFQDLLAIKPRPATPDRCHVVFTLAENHDQCTLEAGTALLAGQDAGGKPRIYRLDRNIALNKAKIGSLKAVVHDATLPHAPFLPDAPIATEACVINSEPITGHASPEAMDKVETIFAPGIAIASALWHVEPTHALLKMTITCDARTFAGFDQKLQHEWNASNRRRLSDTVAIADKNTLICDLFAASYTIDAGQWCTLPKNQTELNLQAGPDGQACPVLELKVLLQPGDPAVMPCMDPAFPEAVAKGLPVFRFVVAQDMLHRYQWVSELQIQTVELEANVLDVRNLVLQNDYGLLDPNVPFQPFGPLPTFGSNFYLGHPRLFNYPLDALKINIEWFQLPTEKEGFAQLYAEYGFEGDNHSFMAVLSILDRKNWWPKQQKQLLKLFQSVSSDQRRTVPNPRDRVSKIRRINEIDLNSIRIPKGSPNMPFLAYDKDSLRGFLRLQLAEPIMAFGHQLYPEILTRQITEAARRKKPLPTPNPPYTPTIKNISLDYTSTVRFSVNARDAEHQEMLYHIHPFGVVCMNEHIGRVPVALLPHYEQGGHLYIGIEGLQPMQPISFLFQISDEGVLDYEVPLEITWAYLTEGQWVDLDKEEQLFDTTLGLQRSGVIGFQITGRIENVDGLLPGTLTWIRCRSNIGTKFLTQLLDLRMQATICSFSNEGNTLEHLEGGLPAGTVNALLVPNSVIASVEQPYPSTGGRPSETPQGYYLRVSELLRHKGRAVSHWDFDHLVLEHFPEIRKVICLSHVDQFGTVTPGHLLVTVIPKTNPADRSRGKVTRISDGRIKEITQFLNFRSSFFAKLTVTNPVVEYVKVSAEIKLKPGFEDHNYYLGRLNQGLREMLSPWYFQDDLSAGISAKIHASRVVEFLDSQYYVDFVVNFKLLHIVNGQVRASGSDHNSFNVVSPLQPHAILVSVDAHALSIHLDDMWIESGIGAMTSQVDLTVYLPEESTDDNEHEADDKDRSISGGDLPSPQGFRIQFKKSTL